MNINKLQLKKLIKDINDITEFKLSFGKERFGKVRCEIKKNNIDIDISIDLIKGKLGILDWDNSLKNKDNLVRYLKKYFNDIERKKEAIWADGYGEAPIKDKVIIPNNFDKKIPTFQIKNKMTVIELKKILGSIRKFKDLRKVKYEGNPKFKLITTIENYKLLEYENNFFFYNIYNLYYLQKKEEFEDVKTLFEYDYKIHRSLEIKSWDNQDFSNPYE